MSNFSARTLWKQGTFAACFTCCAVLVFWLLVPVGASILLVMGSIEQFGLDHSVIGLIAASVSLLCWLSVVAGVILLFRHARSSLKALDVVLLSAGMIAAVAPVTTRICLPWEDPTTGMGSPLASLIGIVFIGLFFGAGWVLPALIMTIWASRYVGADRMRGDTPPYAFAQSTANSAD